MKKRIISIALVVVMIVAMIPATLISASALMINVGYYDVYLHDQEITIDAKKDAIYANSEKIVPLSMVGTKTGFEAYMSATKDALYLYVEVEDPTVGYDYIKHNTEGNKAGNQDKIQLYIANTAGSFNNFDLGYYQNNVGGYTYTQDPECPELFFIKGNGVDVSKLEVATNFIVDPEDEFADPTGWIAEVKIPYTAVNVFGGADAVGPCAGRFILQVNNDDWRWNESKSKYERTDRHRCFSNYIGGDSAWSSCKDQYAAIHYIPDTKTLPYYNTPVTTQTINLDGKLDDIYLEGSKITDGGNQWSDSQRQIGFTTYTAATLAGLYLWTEVDDVTMNNVNETNAENGDMVQYYLDWTRRELSHEANKKVGNEYRLNDENFFGGWVAVDYEGNVAATNDLGNAVKSYVKNAVVKYENPDWDGEDPKTQYIGYAIETFIPWSNDVKDAIGTRDANVHLGIGVQVSDDETHNYGKVDPIYRLDETTEDPDDYVLNSDGSKKDFRTADQKASGEYRTSIAYDTPGGGSYYGAYETLSDMKLVIANDVPDHETYFADTVTSVTLDGINTNGEYDNATKIYVNKHGDGKADADDYYSVVLADDAIYVLMNVVDTTACYTTKDEGYANEKSWYDYIDFATSFGDVWSGMITLRRPKDGNPDFWVQSTSTDRWYGWNEMKSRMTAAATDNATTGFTYELKIALTEADKAAIEAGTFEFASAVQYHDCTSSTTRIYKYSVDRTAFYNGSNAKGSYVGGFNLFRFDTRDTIETVQVNKVSASLGESIDLNLYATLPLEATDAMVKVTFNEKEYYLNAKKTDVVGEYKFTFENIAPQALGDVIVADLIVGGQTISLKKAEDGFTVAKYLEALKDDATYGDVVEALLLYGAAAQKYTNYKADALVADLATLVAPTMNKSVKDVTGGAVDGAKIAAAGVHYANINKIFVKVEATDISKITFTATKNGTPIDIELAELEEGVYIAYTDGIKATEFGDVYTFTITDTTASSQTLKYSVYSYAQAMQTNAKNPNTKTLVNALYNYGVAAAAVN